MRVTADTAEPFVLPTDATTIAEAVELYAAAGLPPVPLYGIRANGECECGPDCPKRTRGKHPKGNNWQTRATCDADEVRDRFRSHTGNIGVYLGSSRLVLLDADGEIGLETAATWNLPETLTAQSGSGVGAHYIYRFADDQDPKLVTDRSKFAAGLDVKARGQFVAAPSRHTSGGRYRWVTVRPPALLPTALYDRLRTPRSQPMLPPDPPSGTFAIGDAAGLERRARAYLARVPPAIDGSGGHNQTYYTACTLWGFILKGLPEAIGLALFREYNATCQPPWSEREFAHKWSEGQKKPRTIEDRAPPAGRLRLVGSAAPRITDDGEILDGDSSPPDGPEPPAGGGGSSGGHQPDWRSELLYKDTRSGAARLKNVPENVIRILQGDPQWSGKIRFDAFRHRITVGADIPWGRWSRPTAHLGYWTDEDATRLAGWMCHAWQSYGFEPSRSDCEHAVSVVSRAHDYNPVAEYLGALEWDGQPRLATWLHVYLGAEPTEYMRLVGGWWLISAVARIYRPGEKVDSVPILEGPQGLRKSTALKVLAGAEFFNDTPIDIGTKDAYTSIQGCWFVELAELESLMRSTPTKSKAFFSSSKDRFRRAYARHEKDELRQCIFVGTVNLREYLNDPTGARRFWPIACSRIDIDALARDRDQLWAEAVHEFEQGRLWYPENEADHELLRPAQEQRTVADAWEEKVARWLAHSTAREVSTIDVLRDCLNLEPKDWTHSAQTRVGTIVGSRLRWGKRRVRRDGGLFWVYERPASEGGS